MPIGDGGVVVRRKQDHYGRVECTRFDKQSLVTVPGCIPPAATPNFLKRILGPLSRILLRCRSALQVRTAP
jgi:hypothetical protein